MHFAMRFQKSLLFWGELQEALLEQCQKNQVLVGLSFRSHLVDQSENSCGWSGWRLTLKQWVTTSLEFAVAILLRLHLAAGQLGLTVAITALSRSVTTCTWLASQWFGRQEVRWCQPHTGSAQKIMIWEYLRCSRCHKMSQELSFWWFRGWFEDIAAWASFEILAHTWKACACLEDVWCLRCTRSRCRSGTLVADMGRELVCWLQGVVFGPGSAKKKKWLTDSYSFQCISISSCLKAPTLEVKSWRWSVFQEALREVSGSRHLRRKTEMSAMSASTSLGDMIMEGKLIRPQTIGWIMFECFLVMWGTLFSHSFSLFLYFFCFLWFHGGVLFAELLRHARALPMDLLLELLRQMPSAREELAAGWLVGQRGPKCAPNNFNL